MSAECAAGLEVLRELQSRARAGRVPLSGSLALTHRCNLRCVHCYAATTRQAAELDSRRLLEVIDEAAGAGCLFLLLTGGEPLVHRDFERLYTRAREQGIVVSLFTNGTLIDDRTLALFRDLPPRVVDITLYGNTEETYRRVTGVPGMAARVRASVERLLAQGINVTVKTVVMTLNRHEFQDIQAQAKTWGVRFRLDAALFPRFDGDREPLRYRLAADEAVELEFSDPDRAAQWRSFHARHGVPPAGPALYQCSAGVWHFHIDPAGNLQPCLMASHIRQNLAASSFDDAWARLGADMAARREASDSRCVSCDRRDLCGYCPPYARLDTGEETGRSDYLCLLGDLRWAKLSGQA